MQRTMLILRNKGFYEFVLSILLRSLFNTLMDLLYSAFVSKLVIFEDFLNFRSCSLGNLATAHDNLWNVQLHRILSIFLWCYLLYVPLVSSLFILGPINGTYGSLITLLSVPLVLGARCLFSLLTVLKKQIYKEI